MSHPIAPVGRRTVLATLLFLIAALPFFLGLPAAEAQQPAQALTPVYAIQGAGAASPFAGARVDTSGVVTGLTPDGFYLQDASGDGRPDTSDGLYVFTYSHPSKTFPAVTLGACVSVRDALVQEYYGKTELSRVGSVITTACPTMSPQPSDLPLLRLGEAAGDAYERFEGMLVTVGALDGIVHGPTKRYASGEAEIALLPYALQPAARAERVLRTDDSLPGSDSFPWPGDSLVYLSSLLGGDLPEVNQGDRLRSVEEAALTGVLDYNFGKYQLLLLPGQALQADARPLPIETGLEASVHDFTVCTYNVHGLGRGEAQYPQPAAYEDALHAAADAIAGPMQGCTVLALQETGTPDDAQALADDLASRHGLSYTSVAVAGPMSLDAEFPLTNSFLVRDDRVEVVNWFASQACSPRDYGVPLSGDTQCPRGQYPLFNRPPLVLDVFVSGEWGEPISLRLIDNHWKSKAGDEDVNAVRRLLQAKHVARIVEESTEANKSYIVVLGDLNDFSDSPPLRLLTGAEPDMAPVLVDTWDLLAAADQYSYIFNGVSQVLDHILIAPNMVQFIAGVDALHINADFAMCETVRQGAPCQSSDHDPLVIQVNPSGAASFGGDLGFAGIEVELVYVGGDVGAMSRYTTVTGADGEFRLWGLPTGEAEVQLRLPDWLLPAERADSSTMRVELSTGYNELAAPDLRLRPAMRAAEAASALVDHVANGR